MHLLAKLAPVALDAVSGLMGGKKDEKTYDAEANDPPETNKKTASVTTSDPFPSGTIT